MKYGEVLHMRHGQGKNRNEWSREILIIRISIESKERFESY